MYLEFIKKTLFIFIFFTSCLSANSIFIINENNQEQNITPFLEIYLDDTKSKTFENILKLDQEFKTFKKESFDFGYIVDKAVWGKITFQNNTNSDIQKVLEYDDPLVSQFFLYEDGKQSQRLQGVKYREPTLENLHNFFYIDIPKNSTKTYYVYLTTDYSATHGKFVVEDEDDFFEKETKHFLLLTVFYTAMGVLIIYNIFLYIFSRDNTYLAYVLFIGNTIFLYSVATAYFYTFIKPSTREYFENDIYSMININLTFVFVIFFIKLFLDTKQYPKINLSLNIFLAFMIVAIPLLSIPSLFYLLEYDIYLCYIAGLYLWMVGFYSITKKNRFGIYFSFGFGLNILALMVSTSHYLGLYPFLYKFPYITEILYLIEGFLFSFVLAQRFKTLEKEKNNLNQKIITLQKDENIRLEKEVNEKTLHLNNSLQFKEKLLKELNHRVKNNMQVIISMIRVQSRQLKNDDDFKEILKEIENRIHTMAKVHELLYNGNDLVDTNSRKYYIETLVYTIQNLFGDDYDVEFEVVCECSFDMNYSMYIGLIINELVFNSFKYAFIDKKGVIKIELKQDDETHILVVEDNGTGFDKQRDESLGLILVKTLVEDKLEGDINIISKNGTKVTIRF